ncbi:MAG: class I SAM-dependent methyltransferase [Bradymonadaceae bacterium]
MIEDDPLEFLKGTLRSPAEVGSIIPSSRYLAEEYVRDFDVEDPAVLELGPGTGPITRVLLRETDDPSRYVGIEQDEEYVDVLREKFSDEAHFYHGSAEEMVDYVDDAGLEEVDLIASALPFATLPQPVQARIYDGLEELMDEGTWFRAVQLAHAWPAPSARKFRRAMNRRFGPFNRSQLVWRNIPPAFVLTWRG